MGGEGRDGSISLFLTRRYALLYANKNNEKGATLNEIVAMGITTPSKKNSRLLVDIVCPNDELKGVVNKMNIALIILIAMNNTHPYVKYLIPTSSVSSCIRYNKPNESNIAAAIEIYGPNKRNPKKPTNCVNAPMVINTVPFCTIEICPDPNSQLPLIRWLTPFKNKIQATNIIIKEIINPIMNHVKGTHIINAVNILCLSGSEFASEYKTTPISIPIIAIETMERINP